MTLRIRPGRRDDAPLLPAIERSAGALFRAIPDLAWIADHDVLDEDDHEDAMAEGWHWVADIDGALAGFLVGARIGDDLHIWELAVDAGHQRKGVGRALVETACSRARADGCASATLTTFRDVAWNEAFYRRLGFATLDDDALDAFLRGVLSQEIEGGLPAERRCAMRRRL